MHASVEGPQASRCTVETTPRPSTSPSRSSLLNAFIPPSLARPPDRTSTGRSSHKKSAKPFAPGTFDSCAASFVIRDSAASWAHSELELSAAPTKAVRRPYVPTAFQISRNHKRSGWVHSVAPAWRSGVRSATSSCIARSSSLSCTNLSVRLSIKVENVLETLWSTGASVSCAGLGGVQNRRNRDIHVMDRGRVLN